MSFDTKAFSAQDALVSALQAKTELSAWRIDFGIPAGRPEPQHIWVDEQVSDWTQDAYTTGLASKTETFRLAVFIYDKQTGSTAQEVRDEIRTAAGYISTVIGSNAFLGGVVLFAQIVAGDYEGAFADPEGRAREGVLKLTVECQSFLA
jgi:hypothetical protein